MQLKVENYYKLINTINSRTCALACWFNYPLFVQLGISSMLLQFHYMCKLFLCCSTLLLVWLGGKFWGNNNIWHNTVYKKVPQPMEVLFFFFFKPGSSKTLLHRMMVTRQAELA